MYSLSRLLKQHTHLNTEIVTGMTDSRIIFRTFEYVQEKLG